MRGLVLALPLLLVAPALGQPVTIQHPQLAALAAQVSAGRERATDTSLVAFGTRHTLSDVKSDARGIGAARRWVQAQFSDFSKSCGGCLEIQTPSQTFTGARVPKPAQVMDVLAVQRGTSDPGRVIVISAHMDSRNGDVLDAKGDAPGANDDGSGVSAVLEAARILSAQKFPATIVYAVLSGEEQGLFGGKVLADYAVAQNWRVEADLNNDIIGNTHGLSGVMDNTHVRVFSEGSRTNETPQQALARHEAGGENDSPSRNIARFMQGMADAYMNGFSARLIYRPDRFRRGGDHHELLAQGFPAVRITEAAENYTRQHQNVRVENGIPYGDVLEGVDFDYLAQVTRLNVITLAALALAPAPPTGVTIAGAVTPDTVVTWKPATDAAFHRVWWRDTIEPQWHFNRQVSANSATLAGINIDDWFFGVSAFGADGYESPVVYPGASGSFGRMPPQAAPEPFIPAPAPNPAH
ncbi:MAG TPA: M20/M25/M40 family metallo-hydrolase [Rhizomicrobium sp.]|nr:M20/M25/M40 family metallo-hydrolase [Rhizomicrobium sp.]